ncbi:Pr6Pr family membrane protein [Parerythrobacter jejuensis]|uniref:Integral membrane protein n=1 Tax=Parerythrobacter jejuensis TaxID=795812 RepID=A0A845AVB8_9SPHN|nr:Pr6Pr family membrane protein [Parerythrobacter jejuensis]MXP30477.1 hypothetical protein [Parerythrobacter jejuensis]MXP33237.1 hypothetical protein [Parerythrobacter jejuensis]
MASVPTTPPSRQARLLAAAIAFLALAALGVQPSLGEGTLLENAGGLVRFFTIWGNIAAAVIMGCIALGRPVSTPVMAALATMLTVIALVYWGLLAADHHPVGLDRITNQVFHTIVPLAVIGWWLRFTPPAPAILPLVPVIMAPPLAYGLFAFVLGELTGFYAYFFLDLPQLGWAQFLLSNLVLAVFFAVLGAGLVALKNVASRYI